MSETIRIERLGVKADGIGIGPGGPAYVPFTLPGETIEAERHGQRARATAILEPSPERQVAPCPHYTHCGGCDLQHASPALYAGFKRDLVVEALRRAGLEAPVRSLVPTAPGTRRRAVFSATRAGTRILFGFHEAMSNRIAPIDTCLVLKPEIVSALPALRRLAEGLVARKGETRLTVTLAGTGLDVAVETGQTLSEPLRARAMQIALSSEFARLSVNGEIVIEPRPPVVLAGDVPVLLPAGAFLQAVAGAEAEMARLALAHLHDCRQVADLFCGVGTFAFRLARHQATHAVENDAASLAALDRAQRAASGLKPLTSERRDLFRRPVTAKELKRFDGVLFDPPRAGAEAQARQLAESSVRRVVAVSCNPLTLARDARILVDGGYRLTEVTPIDQFLWSHHVEAVALFERV